METAKGYYDAAKQMVFGEDQNQTEGAEPKSGQLGEGTADKPYDAGNATGESSNMETSRDDTSAGTTSVSGSTEDPANTEGTREPKTGATAGAGPDVGAAAPESGAAFTQKQQGADRPNEAPEGENAEAIADKKADAENAMSKDTAEEPKSASEEDKSEGGGQKESLGSTSNEPGTGTKYVKTSGVAADGGDFDATKPGAGREADRILEQKGIHREGNTGPPQEAEETKGSDSGKPSIGQKIKDKLHIGKKD